MPANEAQILKEPGTDLTFKATAGVTGKRFLKITGTRTGGGMGGLSTVLDNVYQMAQATANDRACGVAAYDVASGALGRCISGQKVVTVTSGAAVTAGAVIGSDANGKATGAGVTTSLGIALTTVGAADTDLEVKLF